MYTRKWPWWWEIKCKNAHIYIQTYTCRIGRKKRKSWSRKKIGPYFLDLSTVESTHNYSINPPTENCLNHGLELDINLRGIWKTWSMYKSRNAKKNKTYYENHLEFQHEFLFKKNFLIACLYKMIFFTISKMARISLTLS